MSLNNLIMSHLDKIISDDFLIGFRDHSHLFIMYLFICKSLMFSHVNDIYCDILYQTS